MIVGETRAMGRSDWSSFSFSVSRLEFPLLAGAGSKSSVLEMYLGEINSFHRFKYTLIDTLFRRTSKTIFCIFTKRTDALLDETKANCWRSGRRLT